MQGEENPTLYYSWPLLPESIAASPFFRWLPELLRCIAELALGITFIVAYHSWDLVGSVEPANFRHFGRRVYPMNPASRRTATDPGLEAMLSDPVYELILVSFYFFFFGEVLVGWNLVAKVRTGLQCNSWSSTKESGGRCMSESHRAIRCGADCCTSCMPSLCKACCACFCSTAFWGPICERLIFLLVPVFLFVITYSVLYPSQLFEFSMDNSMTLFRAFVVIGIAVLVMRAFSRYIFVYAKRQQQDSNTGECSFANVRMICFWLSPVLYALSFVLVLLWELSSISMYRGNLRVKDHVPDNAYVYPAGLCFGVGVLLQIVVEIRSMISTPSVLCASNALDLVAFCTTSALLWMYLSDYRNDSIDMTQCTDPQVFSTCPCNPCALTAWLFKSKNGRLAPGHDYQPNVDICYTQGDNVMTIGEYCKIRENLPLVLASNFIIRGVLGTVAAIYAIATNGSLDDVEKKPWNGVEKKGRNTTSHLKEPNSHALMDYMDTEHIPLQVHVDFPIDNAGGVPVKPDDDGIRRLPTAATISEHVQALEEEQKLQEQPGIDEESLNDEQLAEWDAAYEEAVQNHTDSMHND